MQLVVTLAQQEGSGGDQVAQRLAGALGLRLLSESQLDRAAEVAGASPLAPRPVHTVVPGLLNRILEALREVPTSPTVPSAAIREQLTWPEMGVSIEPEPSEPRAHFLADRDYAQAMTRALHELAATGGLVLMGRGAAIVLASQPATLHLLTVSPLEDRIRRLARARELSDADSRARIVASDRVQAEYVRRFHRASWLDPVWFDAVLNTGRMSIDVAAEVALDLALRRQREWVPELPEGGAAD